MTAHQWVTEERDGGIDWYDVTFCTRCSAYKPDNDFTRHKGIWLPGTGLENLPEDCDLCFPIVESFKQDTKDAVLRKIKRWHDSQKKKHHKITRSICHYLNWHQGAYEEYVKTGEPPYHYPVSWYR